MLACVVVNFETSLLTWSYLYLFIYLIFNGNDMFNFYVNCHMLIVFHNVIWNIKWEGNKNEYTYNYPQLYGYYRKNIRKVFNAHVITFNWVWEWK